MTRLASQWESLQSLPLGCATGDVRERITLPDGHPQAIRLVLEQSTHKPARHKDGSLQYCAPWSLQYE